MRLPRVRPVFTPVGGAVLAVALFILIRSLIARNSYEIVLACTVMLLLLILGVTGAWRARKLKSLEPGWKPPFPMTADSGEQCVITGLDAPVPLFFRLHFIVRGRFSPAGTYKKNAVCRVLTETSVPRKETRAYLEFDFPVSGVFQGEGYCRLRDIFGFYSLSCGVTQGRTVKVRSAPCFAKNYHINAQSGAEDRRNKHSSDEERYYMREYTPGDRFRDINWKSSEKIDALITRISPDNQEKVSRIEVYFRNYGPAKKPSLQALWLLDRAKARLSHFLRSLIEEQSSYVFTVRAAGGSWEIEDTEDLDAFLEELAGLSFSPPQNEVAVMQNMGELYVFSTACDSGLTGFLLACNPRPVSLYLVQPAEAELKQTRTEYKNLPARGVEIKKAAKSETLYIRDFPAKGCFPPLPWLFGGEIKRLNVNSGRVELIHAGIKL
jgi:hypothetical protein